MAFWSGSKPPDLFNATEIATLLATFPPTLPTSGKPSLLRSRSSQGTLFSSEDILCQFLKLLETSTSRIPLRDLPSKLHIDQTDWIFDCCNEQLIYSSDRGALLPQDEQITFRAYVKQRSDEGLVDLASLASKNNISLQSARLLIDPELSTFEDEETRLQIYSSRFKESSIVRLQELFNNAGSEIVTIDLPLPANLLESFANKAVNPDIGIIKADNGKLMFIPHGHEDIIQQKQSRQVEELCQRLSTEGWCTISANVDPGNSRRREQQEEFAEALRVRSESTTLLLGDISAFGSDIEIWTEQALTQRISDLEAAAEKAITAFWSERDLTKSDSDLNNSFLISLLESHPGNTTLLLASPISRPLHDKTTTLFTQKEEADTALYKTTLQTHLSAPLDLYTTSLTNIPDKTLHANLNEFYLSHFRREILPEVQSHLTTHKLLYPKPRTKEMDKLQSSMSPTKTFLEAKDVIQKFLKKQKIDPPSATLLAETKRKSIERTVRGMKGMTRGSDVLQNLIWVLLGSKGEGVYISSGKDTGRMIKLFRSLGGEEEVVGRLEGWREMLKAGREEKGEVREMRELAARIAGVE